MARLITIFDELDTEASEDAIQLLYDLNIESTTKPIHVLINSQGGSLEACLALYALFSSSCAPIWTYNVGIAYSAGLIAFLAGERRFATKSCAFLAHPPKFGGSDEYRTAKDINISGVHGSTRQNMMSEILYVNSSLTKKQSNEWIDNETYFYLKEAMDKKIVDSVIDKFPTDRMFEDSDYEIIIPQEDK